MFQKQTDMLHNIAVYSTPLWQEYGLVVEGPGRVNVTKCEDLSQALEESCSFDPAGGAGIHAGNAK